MAMTTNNSASTHPPTGGLVPLLLTAAQVGQLLGLTVDGVKHLHRVHRLRGVVVSRKLRFSRASIERFVARLDEEVGV